MSPLPEFLQPLQFHTRPFPRASVAAAIERREESIPHLLQALEWVVQNSQEALEGEPTYILHLFALYLLAQFRETRALPWILQLFRLPQHEALTGDLVTESLARILASTCGGEIAPIQALIEDPAADQWVRSAAVEALGVLAAQDLQPRETVSRYYGELLRGGLERLPECALSNLVGVCADLRMPEHLGAIRTLFEQGTVDPFFIGLREVENQIGSSSPLPDYLGDRYRLIDDTIEEMSFWDCFRPQSAKGSQPGFSDDDAWSDEEYGQPGIPQVRATPKVGRNDPCPCLSGSKYKKCCGKAG